MNKKHFKSFADLSTLKDDLQKDKSTTTSREVVKPNKVQFPITTYKNLSENDRSKWFAILSLLENDFFKDVASGINKSISSNRYSTVTAALTYPKSADSIINQTDLDEALRIATIIKKGVNSGRINYTNARIPKNWPIAGNPGTKR